MLFWSNFKENPPGRRTGRFGSKCWLTVTIWMLVAWILIIQVYLSLSPAQPILTDPRTHGMNFVKLEEAEKLHRLALEKAITDFLNPTSERRPLHFPESKIIIDPKNAAKEDRHFFIPGGDWRDSDGNKIQAHGGGILYVRKTGTFYWYGENKNGPTYHIPGRPSLARVDIIGVNCYSSKDLWEWKNEGLALEADKTNIWSDLYINNVLERPKVVYNEKTQKYVMWMHIDNANYTKASVGVAVSSEPQGPFEYLGSRQPHGFDSRDMTLFKDDDGAVYIVYSSEDNSELHISPLQEDYLNVRNIMARVFVGRSREAPAVFKHRGIYYMVTSDCTGWAPNAAEIHASDNMLGPWQTLGNPCSGGSEELRATTFYSQGTYVLPIPGLLDTFIFMGDRWNSSDLSSSTYVWLPLTIDGPMDAPFEESFEFPFWMRVSIRWYPKWKLPHSWLKRQGFI